MTFLIVVLLLLFKRANCHYVCPERRSSGEEKCLAAFPNLCCSERWSGMNRISHPDWVKICVDPNGQIKLRAKQKYEIFSATYYNTHTHTHTHTYIYIYIYIYIYNKAQHLYVWSVCVVRVGVCIYRTKGNRWCIKAKYVFLYTEIPSDLLIHSKLTSKINKWTNK